MLDSLRTKIFADGADLAEPTDLAFFGLNAKQVGKLGFLRGVDASTKLAAMSGAGPPARGDAS